MCNSKKTYGTIKTTLRIADMRDACTNCSRISPDDRLFLNPMLPVAQKLQPILHPTYNNNYIIIVVTILKCSAGHRVDNL